MAGTDDGDDERRYQAPYSARRPIPTISKYRAEKAARQQESLQTSVSVDGRTEGSGAETQHASRLEHAHPSLDRSPSGVTSLSQHEAASQRGDEKDEDEDGDENDASIQELLNDTSQTDISATDPRHRRKQMKGRNQERAEREVTDPVTHLPVTIHDFTDEAFEGLQPRTSPSGSTPTLTMGRTTKSRSEGQLDDNGANLQQGQDTWTNRFPPPDYDILAKKLQTTGTRAVTAGICGTACLLLGAYGLLRSTANPGTTGSHYGDQSSRASRIIWLLLLGLLAATLWALIKCLGHIISRRMTLDLQDEIWNAHRRQLRSDSKKNESETTVWLNALLGSVWPLINPDLFTSLSDTLEDVMQASLPRLVRMVSVEDIGQGSEAVRILGVRWLPTGAATQSVTQDGQLMSKEASQTHQNGGANGHASHDGGAGAENHQVDANDAPRSGACAEVAHGMEAENGEFVNMEIAFAYHAPSSSKNLRERTKDMHLYLAFYLPGNLKVPVWVDLQGIAGIVRLRLQLMPDPPFFTLCTLTFLGQPKVNLRCTPLSRRALNIMDVPLISNFVQSAVDAAVAEYVAPKSLTLDLKDMLAGEDFKKDTDSVGVIMVTINRGYDFKMADTAIPLVKDGSSDPYVSVGWAKFGKVLWSTRVLASEMEPCWDETCFVLVTPEELNIEERLRVQLWDADRFTADDDLGRIEVPLKEIMSDSRSNGQMRKRSDGFRALRAGEHMPGKLEWSLGYFAKARIRPSQFERQSHDPEIRSVQQLKAKIDRSCERKLRETALRDGQTIRDEEELREVKAQELKAEEDAIIMSAPPPDDLPSGLFSLQIHNIVGLEIEKSNKREADEAADASAEEEAGESLPSSYCTVIINHSSTFKTRTKPQNAKPFFNAGCERFIRNWKDCEVFVAVRDARVHELDPLLGIVHLPLGDVLKERSQVMGLWPLTGGMGHGRLRLSMVWRGLQLQAPRNLLGWSFGTMDVQPLVSSLGCPQDLQSCRLKFRTSLGKGKVYPQNGRAGEWRTKKGRHLTLAVQKRYSSCLSLAFTDTGLLGEKVAAFCVLWLKNIPDDEERELELPIWKGDFERATACCLEDCGDRVGILKVRVTFWSGMGTAHSRWASRNQSRREMVEVIETARDNLDVKKMQDEAGTVDGATSSTDDSESSANEDGSEKTPSRAAGEELGPLDQLREYKNRGRVLHRQHRGIMQWKVPRTAQWVKHKFEKVGDGVTGLFDHHAKQAGVETEV